MSYIVTSTSSKYVGRHLDHPSLAPILKHLPNDISFVQQSGGATVTLTDNGEEASFSALELVAMVLSSAQVRLHHSVVFGGSSPCEEALI